MSNEIKKPKSVHKQLVEFFSDTCLATRGFRPKFSVADMGRLKKVLEENIIDQTHFEQIILFYLADKSFKNLSPSLATMLSANVLNGLRNKALNREQFYKEIELYATRYIRKENSSHAPVKNTRTNSIGDILKGMQAALLKGKGVQR